MSIKNLSVTAALNSAAPPFGAPEGGTLLADINDIARQTLAEIRTLAASDTIASATTCDLGTKDATFLTVSGTTTITGLGTVSAGIYKAVTFSGALTLTHNATSLILPGAANIVTVAGDTAIFLSLGSGNWKCMFYQLASSAPGAAASITGVTASTTELNYVDGVTSAIQTQLNAKAALAGNASQNFATYELTSAAGITTNGITTNGALTSNATAVLNAGIKFPATQYASADVNTLDDYEEGNWTPVVGGTATYTGNTGTYTKIGRHVFLEFDITINLIGTGSTTQITGLPFTPSTRNFAGAVSFYNGLATAVYGLAAHIELGSVAIRFIGPTSLSTAVVNPVTVFANGTRIIGQIAYFI